MPTKKSNDAPLAKMGINDTSCLRQWRVEKTIGLQYIAAVMAVFAALALNEEGGHC